MDELPLRRYRLVRRWFDAWTGDLGAKAIIAGTGNGRVFVDCRADPQVVALWSPGSRVCFVAGDDSNDAGIEALAELFSSRISRLARDLGSPGVGFQGFPLERWVPRLKVVLRGRKIEVRRRLEYVLRPARPVLAAGLISFPHGIEIHRIDRSSLSRAAVEPVWHEIRSRWRSVDGFLAGGIGFYVTRGSWRAIGHCVTANAWARFQEISVSVYDPADRNQGLATAMAGAFAGCCGERGLTPVWVASEGNKPSVAVAEKLGFINTGEYPEFWVEV